MMRNDKVIQDFERRIKRQLSSLPRVVGNEVVVFSKARFNAQGFLDNTFEMWPKRKSKKGAGRNVLVKTGRLRRSIRVVKADWDEVVVGSDVPYAKAHNDGYKGRVTVSAHKRTKYSSTKVGSGKFTKSGKERMKTINSISGSIQVESHLRKMKLPRRRFLGKSQYLLTRLKRTALAHVLKAYR